MNPRVLRALIVIALVWALAAGAFGKGSKPALPKSWTAVPAAHHHHHGR